MNLPEEYLDNSSAVTDEIFENAKALRCVGIILTASDIQNIVLSRKKSLHKYGRIDFKSKISVNMMKAFSDSIYFDSDNFVELINELTDIFYQYRGEINYCLSDEQIISFMKISFDGCCHGETELLRCREMETYRRLSNEGKIYTAEKAYNGEIDSNE